MFEIARIFRDNRLQDDEILLRTKFVNFPRLFFRYFKTICNQTMQCYSIQDALPAVGNEFVLLGYSNLASILKIAHLVHLASLFSKEEFGRAVITTQRVLYF